jgi:quinolinate synthase
MVKEGVIEEMRKKYPDLAVVCYVNSSVELKAKSDVCVTSSNAVKIVKNLPNKNIFFIPDEKLGRFVKEQVPEKNVILNDGCCPRHKQISLESLNELKNKYPNALVLTHPECIEEVVKASDFVGSTAEIIQYAKQSENKEFIICTEVGVLYPLKQNDPDKEFYFVSPTPICHDMKLNTLEKIANVLESGKNQIILSEEQINKALLPLERMLELAK